MDPELKDKLETVGIFIFILGLGYVLGITFPITNLPRWTAEDIHREYVKGYDAGYGEGYAIHWEEYNQSVRNACRMHLDEESMSQISVNCSCPEG